MSTTPSGNQAPNVAAPTTSSSTTTAPTTSTQVAPPQTITTTAAPTLRPAVAPSQTSAPAPAPTTTSTNVPPASRPVLHLHQPGAPGMVASHTQSTAQRPPAPPISVPVPVSVAVPLNSSQAHTTTATTPTSAGGPPRTMTATTPTSAGGTVARPPMVMQQPQQQQQQGQPHVIPINTQRTVVPVNQPTMVYQQQQLQQQGQQRPSTIPIKVMPQQQQPIQQRTIQQPIGQGTTPMQQGQQQQQQRPPMVIHQQQLPQKSQQMQQHPQGVVVRTQPSTPTSAGGAPMISPTARQMPQHPQIQFVESPQPQQQQHQMQHIQQQQPMQIQIHPPQTMPPQPQEKKRGKAGRPPGSGKKKKEEAAKAAAAGADGKAPQPGAPERKKRGPVPGSKRKKKEAAAAVSGAITSPAGSLQSPTTMTSPLTSPTSASSSRDFKAPRRPDGAASDTESDEDPAKKKKRAIEGVDVDDEERSDGSETESDVPSSDDEYIQELPMAYTLGRMDLVSEEELLRLRKERIERLLKIYYSQTRRLKDNLKGMYHEFIRQKTKAINSVALTTANANDIRLRIILESTNAHGSGITAPTTPSIHYIPCQKIVKYDAAGVPLCSYGSCARKRMLATEFCHAHILSDPGQRLYIKCETCDIPILKHTEPPQCRECKEGRTSRYNTAAAEGDTIVVTNANNNAVSTAPTNAATTPAPSSSSVPPVSASNLPPPGKSRRMVVLEEGLPKKPPAVKKYQAAAMSFLDAADEGTDDESDRLEEDVDSDAEDIALLLLEKKRSMDSNNNNNNDAVMEQASRALTTQ